MNTNLNTKNEVAAIIASALQTNLPEAVEVPMASLPKAVWDNFNEVVAAASANVDFANAQESMGFKGFVTFEIGSVYILMVRTSLYDVLMATHGNTNIEHLKRLIGRGRTIVVLRDKESKSVEALGFKAEMLDGDPVYIWRP